jgi:hypothetical protein
MHIADHVRRHEYLYRTPRGGAAGGSPKEYASAVLHKVRSTGLASTVRLSHTTTFPPAVHRDKYAVLPCRSYDAAAVEESVRKERALMVVRATQYVLDTGLSLPHPQARTIERLVDCVIEAAAAAVYRYDIPKTCTDALMGTSRAPDTPPSERDDRGDAEDEHLIERLNVLSAQRALLGAWRLLCHDLPAPTFGWNVTSRAALEVDSDSFPAQLLPRVIVVEPTDVAFALDSMEKLLARRDGLSS